MKKIGYNKPDGRDVIVHEDNERASVPYTPGSPGLREKQEPWEGV